MVQPRNLFHGLPAPETGEVFEQLLGHPSARIERIVSSAAPEPALYDQDDDEWVLLMQGEAVLEIDGAEVRLGPGDWLYIPAHTPHRVRSTSAAPRCVWLAIHLRP